jgi:hypothetical protein
VDWDPGIYGIEGIGGIEEGSRERASAKYIKNLKLCIWTVQLHINMCTSLGLEY